jgi:putative endonuclease
VDDKKIIRLVNAADAYIRIKDVDLAVRFDIVTVITDGAETKIEHLEDAFYPPLSR